MFCFCKVKNYECIFYIGQIVHLIILLRFIFQLYDSLFTCLFQIKLSDLPKAMYYQPHYQFIIPNKMQILLRCSVSVDTHGNNPAASRIFIFLIYCRSSRFLILLRCFFPLFFILAVYTSDLVYCCNYPWYLKYEYVLNQGRLRLRVWQTSALSLLQLIRTRKKRACTQKLDQQ